MAIRRSCQIIYDNFILMISLRLPHLEMMVPEKNAHLLRGPPSAIFDMLATQPQQAVDPDEAAGFGGFIFHGSLSTG